MLIRKKTKHGGFTLIEVMIVVVIVGIIAGIAYPSYMNSVMRSNRADAKAELNDVAQRLQRCFTAHSAYNSASCGVADSISGGDTLTSREGLYSIAATTLTATTYTLTATPVAGTMQANDSACTTLTLDHRGTRGATGTAPDDCW
ncbi:type IV pilin protein [Marinimicrobium alkaliphilum]|uniref:type IV pilin protein n=1 Tax=Marinimicrobium alkaliphilum TaxID=2202654 RepID=UPI000DB99162|nr:type IV pilin protein [Marinimicrobium alkaliphilum]